MITDEFPEDYSWIVADMGGTGEVVAASPSFTKKHKTYQEDICLPASATSKTYEFTLLDSFGDGVCCEHGKGYYRVFDNCGEKIVGSGETDSDFGLKKHIIEISDACLDPTPNPTPTPSSVTCEDQAKDTFHRKYSRK